VQSFVDVVAEKVIFMNAPSQRRTVDPAGFKSLASADLLKQGSVDTRNKMTNFGGPTQNWAPIALSNGKLLIRDQSRMMCVKVAE
jgi:outer membrane protein assembly factor BamB